MGEVIGKGYACKNENGVKKPVSVTTHTKTVWDESRKKYLDTIIHELENYTGLPTTTSLNITEEGKYALDAVAGHKFYDLCQQVFQSADSARNVLASAIGIENKQDYNLSQLSELVKKGMNDIASTIRNKGGVCDDKITFQSLINGINTIQGGLRKTVYNFNLSYNDVAKSWDNQKSGNTIMEYYEPKAKSTDSYIDDSQRNWIICLSRKTLMRLSGVNFIPKQQDIIYSEFDYPRWESWDKEKKEYSSNYYTIHKNYTCDFGFEGSPTCITCLEKHYYESGVTKTSVNSNHRFRYSKKTSRNATYDGYDTESGKRYYTPLNTFWSAWTNNDYFPMYYYDELYVRLKSDYIKGYWKGLMRDNFISTSEGWTKKEIEELKNNRTGKYSIPFRLTIYSK